MARLIAVAPRDDGLRRCGWPECRSVHDARSGPKARGWRRITSLGAVICPVHSDSGHLPSARPVGSGSWNMACECGTRGRVPRMLASSVLDDWEDHVLVLERRGAFS